MKYKRTQKRSKQMWQRVEKFSIRKFSFGAASCLIGASLVGVAINPNIVDAAFKQLNGEDGIVSLYSNSGETPESADGIEIGSKVNVDKEIGIDVDWSQYTRENPIVKVTYTFNGGADSADRITGFGGHRPRFWFTTPIGLKEPKEITLKKNDGNPVYVMKTWGGTKKFGSLSNSINSRFQTIEDINKAYTNPDFRGDDTKWESYNETTGENYREYSGSFANKFWYHIGDRISDDPYEQAIYERFRTNTKTMYVDWERAGIDRATITAVYEVADPTLGNNRSTLEFGAGFRVGIARMMQHYKTVLAPVPTLYKLNEIFEPSVPTRVAVKDTNKLTEEEKKNVRERLWEANKETVTSVARTGKNKLIENLKSEEKTESILIGKDGTATIIYSDNTEDVIPGTSLVYKVTETNTHKVGNGYEYDIKPIAVKDINSITEEEKKRAIKSFLEANGLGVSRLKGHSTKEDIDYSEGTTEESTGITWFAYDENSVNGKNIGTYIGTKKNSSTVMLSIDAGNSGLYTIPISDLYYKEGTSALDLAKKDAEAAIDNLTYLSPKEKQNFKTELASKNSQDDLNTVVNNAIAKNSSNEKALEAKKRDAKEEINNNPYLTNAQKKELTDKVSAVVMTDPTEGGATPIEHTKGLIDKILNEALEKTKEKAKAIIDEIDKKDGKAGYLTDPTADAYKERIKNAPSQAEITKIIGEAQAQVSKKAHDTEKAKADALKEEYKKKIDQIPGLTDDDRNLYKNEIDHATTRDQLEDIVKDAEVKAYRDTAKAKIDALEHLNAAQKAELKTQVDAAGSKAEVDNIVSIAQGLDSKMDSLQKLVAEAEKVKASDKYTNPNVPQDKKTAFDNAKDAASKVADKNTAEPENAAGTSEVATLIDNLAKAIKGLTGEDVAVPVSKDALKAELDLNTDDAVKKSPAYAKETDAAKKKAYDDALANAQKVYDKQDATQTDVDNALETLKQARLALSGKAEDFTLGVKDGAAKISVVPKVGESLKGQADKDAVKAQVTANGKALDNTYVVEYGAIAEKGDKKVVPVTVTHDGITRTVDVPVEGSTAATTTPTADTAKLSETPVKDSKVTKAEDVQKVKEAVKVTEGTQVTDKKLLDEGKVVEGTDQTANGGANNTGKPVVKVEVTYGDGSKDVVEVPVEGNTAATTTPTADTAKLSETPVKDSKVTKAEDVQKVKEAVKVPEGTQVTDKKLLDEGKVVEGTDQSANGGANNAGKPVVKVEVTYGDGSKDVVEVPVEGTDAAKATPNVKDSVTEAGGVPVSVDPSNAPKVAEADKKAITDAVEVPKGQPEPKTKVVKNDGEIVDGKDGNAGKKVVVVEVTYPDGSKDEIEVPVKESDASKTTPKVKDEVTTAGGVPVGVDPTKATKVTEQKDKDAITDAVEVPKDQPQPTDKQVKNDGAIVDGTGANTGKKVVVVEVTYPDGSKDEIEVPVRKATDKEKAKADLTDAANAEKGEISGDTTLTDKEKENLKSKVDEVKKAAEDKINNAKTPEEIAKATEEGKKAIADVYNPQTAKGQSTSIFKPGLDLQTALVSGKATVEKGKDLTDEEILKQLALADGVTAKVISKPTTTETGTKEAEVEVTLADGTKVTVKVPVEVVDSLGTADKDNDLAKAKEDAKKQVEEAAKAKITEIKKDPGLTEEQKQKAEEAINKAKDEANKAIDEASSAGTAKQIADQAKENIEKYDPKADTEVKKPDVTNLDEEKAKAKAEILEEAQKRIDEIKNNKDLSDEAKQKAIEEINKAKDKAIEDINKGQSKDEINAAKEAGIHKINEVQPDGSIASKFEPKVPENKVEVGNPAKLSDEEREQVRQNIEGANTFPAGTTVEVKPDGTAVITYKDGSSDTISKDKLVAPANKETGTIASRTEPVIPGKTQVGNTTKLTPAEQATVKKAVEEANNFPAGTTVEVRPDGTVVITYPDKSVDTITGDKLVEKGSKQETPKVQTDAEKNPAQVPGNFVPVENTHNLTQAEQDTVAAKVKEANPAATDVKVSKYGTATLTYSDGSVNTIPGTSLVVAKDTENEVATQAAQTPAVVPATTEVGNAHSLTPEEQAAVTAKVQAANPAATAVKVSKDGTATLTYSDGSVNTIPGTSLVVQKEETSTQEQPTIAEKTKVIIPANPTKVAEATRLTDAEKEAVKQAVVEANGFGSDVNVEVAGDGTATIVFKDGSAITIPGNQLVAQDPKAQDSTKPTAEKSTVKAPAQRVDVKDITHLTDEEKEKVKVAILQANGSALDGATINVAGDGTATITFPDGSVVTILGKDTVQQSAIQEQKPEYTPESTPGGDNGGNTGSSDANANAGGGSNAGEPANTGSQPPAQSQASKQLANAKESAKNVIEKAAKDKQDEIKGAPLSDKEKAELLARVEAEKQAALKEIENAKTVEDVKEAEMIGVQAIAMVTVPKKPVAPNAAPQATSAPQATAGTMQDVTYQSPAGKQLPNTGSASSAALASLGIVAATSGFALLGRKARRRK